jgi:hypothetical protein
LANRNNGRGQREKDGNAFSERIAGTKGRLT